MNIEQDGLWHLKSRKDRPTITPQKIYRRQLTEKTEVVSGPKHPLISAKRFHKKFCLKPYSATPIHSLLPTKLVVKSKIAKNGTALVYLRLRVSIWLSVVAAERAAILLQTPMAFLHAILMKLPVVIGSIIPPPLPRLT